ncbi:MAG: hypothetical protein ACFHU9_13620 [Fluviicola sp.]
MRFIVVFVFILLCLRSNGQLPNPPVRNYPYQPLDFPVNDYLYDHCEIGGGGHVLIILPGAHLKLRYAPINYQHIKLIGEVRGELVTAPIAGWNYNFKFATGFENGLGIRAGLGRTHYVWRRRTSVTEFEVRNVFQNTAEVGIRWEAYIRQWEVWASLPLYNNQHVPIFTVGVSVTAGGLWDFKDQKWFLPQRK